ncbi:hypothetical protein LguiA_007958 [Lonicera macranthoides]
MPYIESFEGFQNLQALAFGGCQLTGQIPNWLVEMTKLEVLDLSLNQLTGSIPSWLGHLPNLFYLDLFINFLLGEFPKELIGLPKLASVQISESIDRSYLELPMFVQPSNASDLQYNQLANLPPAIYLGNNSLTGIIPDEIGRLKLLHILDISNNSFSGTIPEQISMLTNLERLDLSGKNLSGKIPTSLKNLHFLSYFSVANNNLQGLIPAGGQFDTFSSSSYEGNSGLCGPILQRPCINSSSTAIQPLESRRRSPNTKLIVGLLFGILFVIGVISTVLTLWMLTSNRWIVPRGDPDISDFEARGIILEFRPGLTICRDQLWIPFWSYCFQTTKEIKVLTIAKILKAADIFNQVNIISCGGYGVVCKATLENGTSVTVAVKKLSGEIGAATASHPQ